MAVERVRRWIGARFDRLDCALRRQARQDWIFGNRLGLRSVDISPLRGTGARFDAMAGWMMQR